MNPNWIFLLDKIRRRRKPPQNEISKTGSDKSAPEVLITACWYEYQTVNSLMLRLMETASQVQIYAVVLLGGLIPLIQYVESVAKDGGDAYILYLFAALVFATLGGYQIHLDNQVAEIDNYILLHLSPKVRALVNFLSIGDEKEEFINAIAAEILGYHLYWRTIRYNRFLGIWLSLGVLGRTGLAVLSTIGLYAAYFYYEYFYNPNPPKWSIVLVGFSVAIGASIVWMLISSVIVRFKYSTATNNYLAQNPDQSDYLHGGMYENGITKKSPVKPAQTEEKKKRAKPKRTP